MLQELVHRVGQLAAEAAKVGEFRLALRLMRVAADVDREVRK